MPRTEAGLDRANTATGVHGAWYTASFLRGRDQSDRGGGLLGHLMLQRSARQRHGQHRQIPHMVGEEDPADIVRVGQS